MSEKEVRAGLVAAREALTAATAAIQRVERLLGSPEPEPDDVVVDPSVCPHPEAMRRALPTLGEGMTWLCMACLETVSMETPPEPTMNPDAGAAVADSPST